jgi:hypothetical protein
MNIQFLKDTSTAVIENNPVDTLLVYREGYNLPQLNGVEYLDFNVFKTRYSELHFNKLILVGLNRIITPTNRCDMVNDFMQTMTNHVEKVSIDNHPFIGEPWRLWYHYDVTKKGKFKFPHGYATETEWKKWFYRDVQTSMFDGDNIGLYIADTHSDLDRLNTRFEFNEVSPSDMEFYLNAKSDVFEKHDSPKMLINTLLKHCNKHFNQNITFDSYRSGDYFLLPDLPIYQFMVEENKRRMDTYNAVIK